MCVEGGLQGNRLTAEIVWNHILFIIGGGFVVGKIVEVAVWTSDANGELMGKSPLLVDRTVDEDQWFNAAAFSVWGNSPMPADLWQSDYVLASIDKMRLWLSARCSYH